MELGYSHDRASNRAAMTNLNPAQSGWTNRDSRFEYDGLDRLKKADRGVAGGSFTHVADSAVFTPGQAWALDMLGNWKELVTDKNQTGAIEDTVGMVSDSTEARNHDFANQDLDNNAAFGLNHSFEVPQAEDRMAAVEPEAGVDLQPDLQHLDCACIDPDHA